MKIILISFHPNKDICLKQQEVLETKVRQHNNCKSCDENLPEDIVFIWVTALGWYELICEKCFHKFFT